MPTTANWTRTVTASTTAHADVVWAILADAAAWPEWNAGVGALALEGPFATGTWFTMTMPDGAALRSQLVEVEAPRRFIDETRVDDLVVRVAHEVAPAANGAQVRYTISVDGPDAAEAGTHISGDFEDVIASLVARAEARA
jgi:hypothetical protein